MTDRDPRAVDVRVKWEPRDLWIGVYRDPANRRTYICLLPCLPIIVSRSAGEAGDRHRPTDELVQEMRDEMTRLARSQGAAIRSAGEARPELDRP